MECDRQQRLLDVLDGHRRSESTQRNTGTTSLPRLTVVCAPIGYGKTTLLSRWLQASTRSAQQTIWVHCPPRRPHFQTGTDLPARVSVWQVCAERISFALGKPVPAHEATFETVYQLASQIRTPHTLIIDDYHRDTTPANDYQISELARLQVPLHILVLARRLAVLDGPMIAGRNNVQVITQEDLALTGPEISELLSDAGVARSPSVDRFFASLEGWPLAVTAALTGQSGAARQQPGRTVERAPVSRFEDNLGRFVRHQVDVMGDASRKLLLSAALLDSMSLELAADVAGLSFDVAVNAFFELIERGMIVSITEHAPSQQSSTHGHSEFRCPAALRPLLAPLAEGAFDEQARTSLLISRARELTVATPVSAFVMFCEAKAFAEAEAVLIENFGLIIGDGPAVIPALRAIPRAALLSHPALISARLFLETENPKVPPATLHRLSVLLRHGVFNQLAAHAIAIGAWPDHSVQKFTGIDALAPELRLELLRTAPLPLLAQAMTSARLQGRREEAQDLAFKLELRVSATPMNDTSFAPDVAPSVESRGDQPADTNIALAELLLYLHEIAVTATDCGDLVQARRAWAKLQSVAGNLVAQPRRGITTATNLTDVDVQTGQRWLLVSLEGLAFTETHEGNLTRVTQLLEQSAQIAEHTGLRPPGSAWIHGAVARCALASETGEMAEFATYSNLLEPLRDRIEPWALLLIAETTAVRREQGAQWALQQLEASLRRLDRTQSHTSSWRVWLSAVQAELYTVVGNFKAAHRAIDRMPTNTVSTAIERARLHLFSGNDLAAIRITAAIGDSGITVRQRADRCLIRAAAAWQSGQQQEANLAFASGRDQLEASGLQSPLWGVPYDALQAIDTAENALLVQVPLIARAARFERLTEMELRTLQSVAAHGTTAGTAEAMFVTPATVKKHLNSVYRKLRAHNRSEALLQASRMGLLP